MRVRGGWIRAIAFEATPCWKTGGKLGQIEGVFPTRGPICPGFRRLGRLSAKGWGDLALTNALTLLPMEVPEARYLVLALFVDKRWGNLTSKNARASSMQVMP